jgi:hypothetical protein
MMLVFVVQGEDEAWLDDMAAAAEGGAEEEMSLEVFVCV